MHHHDDGRSGCRHGRQRVHHNAQLAVVGVGLVGVQVRYLGDGQQRQKDKAHDRNDRQKARPELRFLRKCASNPVNRATSCILILQKNVLVWTVNGRGCLK